MSPSTLCRRKKCLISSFYEFYKDWISAINTTLLPDLRRAIESASVSPVVLSAQIDAVHSHFNLYYASLDEAAAVDVSRCLFPEWRNRLEKPFLWLGDFHPYLFTNLLRSFLDEEEEGNGDGLESEAETGTECPGRRTHRALTASVDQIECGLRLMVPALAARSRNAQANLAKKIGAMWAEGNAGRRESLSKAVEEETEELVGVFVDANRLRRSLLSDILSATSRYQGALYLEALLEFVAGFRDEKLLVTLENCENVVN